MTPTPVVLVHGLFGPFSEPATCDRLAPAECSAPDLDGYGARRGRPVTLDGQVDELRDHVVDVARPVHLVAHSIGAVYALVLAESDPALVASVTLVEGNLTIADAFWSLSIAAMEADRAAESIGARLADPAAFLAADGIAPTPVLLARAREALAYQPWRTVWESAQAVVETTSAPAYEDTVRRVLGLVPVHLVAGERSQSEWHVPEWVRAGAASASVLPSTGHLMMLERPEAFGRLLADVLAGEP